MKSTDNVGITFANVVISRGILDHVVNVTLGAFQFTPTNEGKIDNDLVVTSRLRLSKGCAKQLRDCLDDLLTAVDKAEAVPVGIASNGDGRHPEESLN